MLSKKSFKNHLTIIVIIAYHCAILRKSVVSAVSLVSYYVSLV